MKRDMDLVREILIAIEDDPRFDGSTFIGSHELYKTAQRESLANYPPGELDYHLSMLIEQGYIKGRYPPATLSDFGPPSPLISKLTWEGHELCASIRDPDIWTKTKGRAGQIAAVTFPIFVEIAKSEIKKRLGLA
jgi:hypothetical protein